MFESRRLAGGLDYLAAHRGYEATEEFQKILDHSGVVSNEPIGALAHVQLGGAYALQGDTTKARTSYEDFLALWKDADPDIPVLKQAKTEYAKLERAAALGPPFAVCVLVQPEMERGRSPLVSIPPLGRGFSRHRYDHQAIPQHGCVPAEPASVSPGKIIVAPPRPSVSTSG